jgi:hypothetical protein
MKDERLDQQSHDGHKHTKCEDGREEYGRGRVEDRAVDFRSLPSFFPPDAASGLVVTLNSRLS